MSPEPLSEPQPADANRIKIHNWPDASDPINDETVLVRYMRLETFLLLLDGRVFIPTLKQLQSGDSNEGLLPFMRTGFYSDKMRSIIVPHKDTWTPRDSSPRTNLLFPAPCGTLAYGWSCNSDVRLDILKEAGQRAVHQWLKSPSAGNSARRRRSRPQPRSILPDWLSYAVPHAATVQARSCPVPLKAQTGEFPYLGHMIIACTGLPRVVAGTVPE
jgi:hypothetical protein